jgi:hypothetical protein
MDIFSAVVRLIKDIRNFLAWRGGVGRKVEAKRSKEITTKRGFPR